MGLEKGGLLNAPLTRKEFIQACATATAVMGLPSDKLMQVVEAAENKAKPPVIWLHLQECTGDSETLLRSTHPSVAKLILELVTLDYHETLMAAAGHQAEKSLHDSMHANKGRYILVVEGAIPVKDNGVYCKIGGKTALDLLKETAKDAYAIIAIGNCATFGGPQAAPPNPTDARGVGDIIKDKPIINLPGCPVNPYNLLSTVLYIMTWNKLPKVDKFGRPLFAYGKLIHEHCERRGHFDAGRFVKAYGDEAHQKGHCLFIMGCKGPVTYGNCPATRFNDVDVWPVSNGSPCYGCTENKVAFFTQLHDAAVPVTYPAINNEDRGGIGAVTAGLAGAAVGVAAGVAAALSSKVPDQEEGNE